MTVFIGVGFEGNRPGPGFVASAPYRIVYCIYTTYRDSAAAKSAQNKRSEYTLDGIWTAIFRCAILRPHSTTVLVARSNGRFR